MACIESGCSSQEGPYNVTWISLVILQMDKMGPGEMTGSAQEHTGSPWLRRGPTPWATLSSVGNAALLI